MTAKKIRSLSQRLKRLEMKQTDFSEEDFVAFLDLTMKQQALENPALKGIYRKLTPQFESRVRQVALLFETPDNELEDTSFKDLLKGGDTALLAALEYLLHLKKRRGPVL